MTARDRRIEQSRISDETELEKRKDLPHAKAIRKAILEEDILRAPMTYKKMTLIGMWSR